MDNDSNSSNSKLNSKPLSNSNSEARPKARLSPERLDRLKLAEWGEQLARLKADPAFSRLMDFYMARLEKETLEISPDKIEMFRGLAYRRQAVFEITNTIRNGIELGKQARREMDPDYEPAAGFAV